MARRIVGLEIGPESIRAVQIAFDLFGEPVVEKMTETEIIGGIESNGKITNPELLGQQLKSFWKREHLQSKQVALGLGGTDVFVREFAVPEMKPDSLSGALSALAEGSLPMPTTELLLDFYPARVSTDGENNSVGGLLLAATKTSTDALLAALQSAGLSLQSLDLVPFALLRELNVERSTEEVVAIVHSSSGYLNMVVAKGHVPIFIRMVPLPTLLRTGQESDSSETSLNSNLDSESQPSDESKAIEEYGNLNTTEILTLRGDTPASSEFQDAALRELKETLDYYTRNHPKNKISVLLTSGKGLENSEWLTLLGQQIWLPSESHTLTTKYKRGSGKTERVRVPSDFLVAYCLAKGQGRG